MKKNNVSIADDYLKYIENLQNGKNNRRQRKTRQIPKFFNKVNIAIFTVLTCIVTLISACAIKKKEQSNSSSTTPTYSTIGSTPLDNLGSELSFNNETKNEYGNTTNGIANPNTVVKDSNGKIYVDQEAYDNKNNVGTTVTDTKNNTLEVRDNGKVYEKEDTTVIIDENGEVKETDKTNSNTKYTPDGTPIPDGYAWDENRKEMVPQNEVGKYVYDDDGQLVLKETYEETKKAPTGEDAIIEETTEEVITPIKTEEPKVETKKEETKVGEEVIEVTTDEVVTNVTDIGVINADGTYTVSGLTFESKADYQQWIIQGYTGYAMDIDGIMKSEETLTQSKTLVK